MNIIKLYPLLFFVAVILPFLGGVVAAYLGWDNLKTRYEDDLYKKTLSNTAQNVLLGQQEIKKALNKDSEKQALEATIKSKVSTIIAQTTYFFEMSKKAGLNLDPSSQITRSNLKLICEKINPYDDSHMSDNAATRRLTWLETMISSKNTTITLAKELVSLKSYIKNPEVINLVYAIKDSVFFDVLGVVDSTELPIGKNLKSLEPHMYEYIKNLEKLNIEINEKSK